MSAVAAMVVETVVSVRKAGARYGRPIFLCYSAYPRGRGDLERWEARWIDFPTVFDDRSYDHCSNGRKFNDAHPYIPHLPM